MFSSAGESGTSLGNVPIKMYLIPLNLVYNQVECHILSMVWKNPCACSSQFTIWKYSKEKEIVIQKNPSM